MDAPEPSTICARTDQATFIIQDELCCPVPQVIAESFHLLINERDLPVPSSLALADSEEPVLKIDVPMRLMRNARGM